MAGMARFELTLHRLTADCLTTKLHTSIMAQRLRLELRTMVLETIVLPIKLSLYIYSSNRQITTIFKRKGSYGRWCRLRELNSYPRIESPLY